jgi:hypothetical protein
MDPLNIRPKLVCEGFHARHATNRAAGFSMIRSGMPRRKLAKEWDEIGEAIEDVLALVDAYLPLMVTLHATALEIARE